MKKEELMIGDWVFNTHNRKPEQVCEIRERMVMLNYNDLYEYDEVEPIPLTEEILLNNGFDKIKPNGYTSPRQEYAYSSDFEDVYAEEINDGMWKIDIDSVEFNLPRRTMFVGYVHTLQHVLKECAVDNDITSGRIRIIKRKEL